VISPGTDKIYRTQSCRAGIPELSQGAALRCHISPLGSWLSVQQNSTSHSTMIGSLVISPDCGFSCTSWQTKSSAGSKTFGRMMGRVSYLRSFCL